MLVEHVDKRHEHLFLFRSVSHSVKGTVHRLVVVTIDSESHTGLLLRAVTLHKFFRYYDDTLLHHLHYDGSHTLQSGLFLDVGGCHPAVVIK